MHLSTQVSSSSSSNSNWPVADGQFKAADSDWRCVATLVAPLATQKGPLQSLAAQLTYLYFVRSVCGLTSKQKHTNERTENLLPGWLSFLLLVQTIANADDWKCERITNQRRIRDDEIRNIIEEHTMKLQQQLSNCLNAAAALIYSSSSLDQTKPNQCIAATLASTK